MKNAHQLVHQLPLAHASQVRNAHQNRELQKETVQLDLGFVVSYLYIQSQNSFLIFKIYRGIFMKDHIPSRPDSSLIPGWHTTSCLPWKYLYPPLRITHVLDLTLILRCYIHNNVWCHHYNKHIIHKKPWIPKFLYSFYHWNMLLYHQESFRWHLPIEIGLSTIWWLRSCITRHWSMWGYICCSRTNWKKSSNYLWNEYRIPQ